MKISIIKGMLSEEHIAPPQRDWFRWLVVFVVIPSVTALLAEFVLEGALGFPLAAVVGLAIGFAVAYVVQKLDSVKFPR